MLQTLFGSGVPVTTQYTGDPYVHGQEFVSSTNGSVVGVRFYKTAGMTGIHTAGLYDTFSNLLKSVVFTETVSGWQEYYFDTPVLIDAGTPYVVAVCFADGVRLVTTPFSGVVNGDLSATANSGRYLQTSILTFPNSIGSFGLYVDVIFDSGITPPTPIPDVRLATLTSVSNNVLSAEHINVVATAIITSMALGEFNTIVQHAFNEEEARGVLNALASYGYTAKATVDGNMIYTISIQWPRK